MHPDEGGISVLYSFQNSDQQLTRWTTSSVSVSSRVHEYGGGAFIVYNGIVYLVNHSDQKLHMMTEPLKETIPLTKGSSMRYADCAFHPFANKIICVREDHSVVESGASKEAQNTIILLDIATQTETILVCSRIHFFVSKLVSAQLGILQLSNNINDLDEILLDEKWN